MPPPSKDLIAPRGALNHARPRHGRGFTRMGLCNDAMARKARLLDRGCTRTAFTLARVDMQSGLRSGSFPARNPALFLALEKSTTIPGEMALEMTGSSLRDQSNCYDGCGCVPGPLARTTVSGRFTPRPAATTWRSTDALVDTNQVVQASVSALRPRDPAEATTAPRSRCLGQPDGDARGGAEENPAGALQEMLQGWQGGDPERLDDDVGRRHDRTECRRGGACRRIWGCSSQPGCWSRRASRRRARAGWQHSRPRSVGIHGRTEAHCGAATSAPRARSLHGWACAEEGSPGPAPRRSLQSKLRRPSATRVLRGTTEQEEEGTRQVRSDAVLGRAGAAGDAWFSAGRVHGGQHGVGGFPVNAASPPAL